MAEDAADRERSATPDESEASANVHERDDSDGGGSSIDADTDRDADAGEAVGRDDEAIDEDDDEESDRRDAFVFEDPSEVPAGMRASVEDGPSEGGADAPFSGLANRIRDSEGTAAEGDVDDLRHSDESDLFDRETVPELDAERLWERLEHDDSAPTSDVQERSIRRISKRAYCEGCEHFSDPPDVACSHEGTTILELTDLETFTVANCPVVREKEALEESS